MRRLSPILVLAGTAAWSVGLPGSGASPAAGEARADDGPAPAAAPTAVLRPLTVRVTTEKGPLAGASVRVRRKQETRVFLVAKTDAAGIARFEPLDLEAVVVEVLAEGFRPTSTEKVGIRERDGALEFSLEPGTPVRGTAQGPLGEPEPATSILLQTTGGTFDLGLVDARGGFVVPGLSPADGARLVGTAPGRVRSTESVGADESDVVLRMQTARTVVGRVVGAEGVGIPAASVAVGTAFFDFDFDFDGEEEPIVVEADSPQPPTTDGRPFLDSLDRFERESNSVPRHQAVDPDAPRTTTGADGSFSLEGVPMFESFLLRVQAPGRLPAEIRLFADAEGRVAPSRIVLRPAATVRVRVSAETATREDVNVRVFHGAGESSLPTGGSGLEYVFEGIEPGPVAAFAAMPGRRNAVERSTGAPGGESVVAIELHPLATISGTVVDPRGEPLHGARVDVRGPQGEMLDTVETGGDGRFEVRDAPPHACDLTAQWPRDPSRRRQVFRSRAPLRVRAPSNELRIETREVGGIGFRLVDPDGRPIREACSVLFGGQRTHLQGGVFAAHDLPDAEHEVSAVVRGWTWHRRTVRIANGKAVDLGDLEVAAGATLSGRVLDTAGRPVAGAALGPVVENEDVLRTRRFAWPGDASILTDPEGRFTLDGAPRGRVVRLRVSAQGRTTRRLDATVGDDPLEIRLDPQGTLRGVLLADRPDDGAEIDVRFHRAGDAPDEAYSVPVVFDAEGIFTIPLDAGTWLALWTDPTGRPAVLGSWRVAPGAVVGATLRIPRR